MKHLPLITLLFWGLIVAFYSFSREIFLLPAIKFPLLIVLTIFLAISFWTLMKKGRRLLSLVFVAIFVFNTGILAYGLVHNQGLLAQLTSNSGDQLDPELAKLLITADNEKERETAARIIYERHGIALAYKTDMNSYTLYQASKSDRDAHLDNHERRVQQEHFRDNLFYQTVPLFFLFVLQIVIFLGLLIYLTLCDNKTLQTEE